MAGHRNTPRSGIAHHGQAQRLPVNPRRHRVAPEHRKRVATACNSCNVRRVKCSGQRPCTQCANANRECQYPVVIEKVTLPKSEVEELRARCQALERAVERYVPASQRPLGLGIISSSDRGSLSPEQKYPPTLPSSSPEIAPLAEDEELDSHSDGLLLRDPDGTARYLGETSGATFLDHVKEFMKPLSHLFVQSAYPTPPSPYAHSYPAPPPTPSESAFLASQGQYQTFDSRPLFSPSLALESGIDPLYLPPRTEMNAMLLELRYFLQDGNRSYPSGGIWFWGNFATFPEPGGQQRNLALYQTAFAVATQLGALARSPHGSPLLGSEDGAAGGSEAFFARARILLGNPLDVPNFSASDISILALMAFYLLEMNRRDTASMYINFAIHLCVVHGVHRWAATEEIRRAFWTVYILDRYISCLMGRPPALQDEAIALEDPVDVMELPPAAGLRAHVQLSRITNHIVCNTYRIAPYESSQAHATARIERALLMLDNWHASLPRVLSMNEEKLSNDRACCDLHMCYNQLIILAIRPLFFTVIKRIVADRYLSSTTPGSHTPHANPSPIPHSPNSSPLPSPPSILPSSRYPATPDLEAHPAAAHFNTLLSAARRNLRLAAWVRDLSPTKKLMQPELHHVFNAALSLLLYHLVAPAVQDTDSADITFAIMCFEREAAAGSNYGVDCARVLKDLSSLVQRIRSQGFIHSQQPQYLRHGQGAGYHAAAPAGLTGGPVGGVPVPAVCLPSDIESVYAGVSSTSWVPSSPATTGVNIPSVNIPLPPMVLANQAYPGLSWGLTGEDTYAGYGM